jgi:aryl carrier-like protein
VTETTLEASVREVWTEVLGVADVDATTPFFELGGDSVGAMQVVSRLRARYGALSMRTFMAAPTIAGLIAFLDGATPRKRTPVRQAPVAVNEVARYPLSRAQRQMWDIANHLPDVPLFVVAGALRVDGPLDVAVLQRTFTELTMRHEALRARFEDTGDGPVQVVEPQGTVTVEVEDLTDEERPERRCEKLMGAATREALPVDTAPLLRVVVYRLADDRHVLFFNAHHIVCDGQSLAVLQSDVARLYREIAGGAPAPRPVPIGSGRLARDRADWLTTDDAARQREFWLDKLAAPWPTLADGPGSRFAGAGEASLAQRMRSATTSAKLSADDMALVRAAARKHGMTEFMVVLAGYAATLGEWSGQDDIRVATMLANRAEPGMAEVVGLVTNAVVLRMRLDTKDPVAIGTQARDVCADAFEHQQLPYEEVLAELNDRHPKAGPVFEAMLVAEKEIDAVTPDDGLVFAPYESDRNVLGGQVAANGSGFVLDVLPIGDESLCTLRFKPATTSRELAAELLDAIVAAVRATATALTEAGTLMHAGDRS